MDLPLIQSKSRAPFPPHPRFNRHHHNPNPNPNPNRTKLLIISAALFSFLLLSSAALRLHYNRRTATTFPGAVIHSSLNWSQIHVFTSLDDRGLSSEKVGPGLGRLLGDPEGAERVLKELAEFVEVRVPTSEWGNTRVQLIGDVALKGVGMGEVGPVWDLWKGVLRSSGFEVKDEWVTFVEGRDEGLYDWVAGNYALGTLGSEPQRTTGIVKLGGTSMQVTVCSEDPQRVSFPGMIKLAGVTYNLYTESMSYLGQDSVRESLGKLYNSKDLLTVYSSGDGVLRNPCFPRGYKFSINASDAEVVAGNYSLCRSHVGALLKRGRDKCSRPPCEIVPSSLAKLLGKPIPPNKFFFISELLGMVPKTSLSELEAAGHHYCEDDWHKLKSENNSVDDLDLLSYCFSSAYLVALLHDNFGVPMTDKRINLATSNSNIPPAWIYGAFILQMMKEPLEMERGITEEIVGNDAVTYLSLFTVLLIAIMGAVFLLKCQKPQVKKVYDLQKGHYIITRLPR